MRDNLKYVGEMYGLRGKRLNQRIEQLLQEFGLADKVEVRARILSGGMKRRLNFALADVHTPELIFLDEPTVGLDPNARLVVWQIIQGFRQAGKTVLLTTHYMEEAEAMCDRIILIAQGKIVAQGTPMQLKTGMSNDIVLNYQVTGIISSSLIDELNAQPGVAQANSEGNNFRVVVQRNEAEAVKEWLARKGLHITSLATEDISLEDVFIHLIGRHLQAAG